MRWIATGPGSDGGFYAVRQRQAVHHIGPHQSLDAAQASADAENEKERARDASTKLLAALKVAVELYGKPGGPWNVPSDPGSWLAQAREAIAAAEGTAS